MSLSQKCRTMGLIYNDSLILGHPFYGVAPSTLKRVSEKDYPGENHFSKDALCIDLDAYEEMQCGQNDCTVDAVIGVADYNRNKLANASLALVELRMKYRSVSNLDFSNMARKVQHSKGLLAGSIFHDKDYFLFSASVAPQAINAFRRHCPTYPDLKNAKVLSVQSFENEIGFIEDYPYEPVYSKDDIVASLAVDNPQKLMSQLDYWLLNVVQKLRDRHELNEVRHILDVLNMFLKNLIPFGDFTQEFIDMYLEDVSNTINSVK